MNEWIIAPLLAADGTATHRPGGAGSDPGSDKQDKQDKQDDLGEDRRHGDRREHHDEDADPDFARGEDRRDDAPLP